MNNIKIPLIKTNKSGLEKLENSIYTPWKWIEGEGWIKVKIATSKDEVAND